MIRKYSSPFDHHALELVHPVSVTKRTPGSCFLACMMIRRNLPRHLRLLTFHAATLEEDFLRLLPSGGFAGPDGGGVGLGGVSPLPPGGFPGSSRGGSSPSPSSATSGPTSFPSTSGSTTTQSSGVPLLPNPGGEVLLRGGVLSFPGCRSLPRLSPVSTGADVSCLPGLRPRRHSGEEVVISSLCAGGVRGSVGHGGAEAPVHLLTRVTCDSPISP